MKVHFEGEKGRAICDKDGLTTMSYTYRDVPFSDGLGMAKGILVGVCDKCGEVIAVPPQSTPAIKAARDAATVPIEASLPGIYLEVLNLACYRINPQMSAVRKDVHKQLLTYYVHILSENEKRAKRLSDSVKKNDLLSQSSAAGKIKKRLSMKVSEATSARMEHLKSQSNVTTTELLKSVIAEIDKDIVRPDKPAHLKSLQMMLAVANG